MNEVSLVVFFFFFFFFLSRTFTIDRKFGEAWGISLTHFCHFLPLQRHLEINRIIITESSPLHIMSSRTQTGCLYFPSGIWQPLSHAHITIHFCPVTIKINLHSRQPVDFRFGKRHFFRNRKKFGYSFIINEIVKFTKHILTILICFLIYSVKTYAIGT